MVGESVGAPSTIQEVPFQTQYLIWFEVVVAATITAVAVLKGPSRIGAVVHVLHIIPIGTTKKGKPVTPANQDGKCMILGQAASP